ncbi:MAG: tyrosine-type recombinase/integrase [Ignavibacteriales bacterium]
MGVYLKGNRWYIDYYYNGRRKREVVGPANKITRTQAEKALKARIRIGEIVQGKFNLETTKKPVLFERLTGRYLEWARTNHRCCQRDEVAAKVFLKFFGGKLLSQIKSWDIEKYKRDRKTQGRKPWTINKELTVIKCMFNLGIQWNMTTSNPVKGVKLMEIPKVPYRTLSDNEFERIYHGASPEFRPVLLCAYATGMRKGEILNLKWEDIDFRSGHILVKETKNNESRAIPMDDTLKEVLDKLKSNKGEGKYIFLSFKESPVTLFYREFRSAIRKAGVQCTFHSLRHTFTSNLMTRCKEDPRTVMELTGHKDVGMLMHYSHTKEDLKKAAITKLGNLVKSLDLDTSSDTSLEDKCIIKPSNGL